MSGILMALVGGAKYAFASTSLSASSTFDYQIRYNSTPGSATSSATFTPDGLIVYGAGESTGSFTWGTPAVPAGSDYSILCTVNSSIGGGTFTNPAASWVDLGAARQFSLSISRSSVGINFVSRNTTISIRRNSDLTVVASATFTFEAQIEISSSSPP